MSTSKLPFNLPNRGDSTHDKQSTPPSLAEVLSVITRACHRCEGVETTPYNRFHHSVLQIRIGDITCTVTGLDADEQNSAFLVNSSSPAFETADIPRITPEIDTFICGNFGENSAPLTSAPIVLSSELTEEKNAVALVQLEGLLKLALGINIPLSKTLLPTREQPMTADMVQNNGEVTRLLGYF